MVPLSQFHVGPSPSRPEVGIQCMLWRCCPRVAAVLGCPPPQDKELKARPCSAYVILSALAKVASPYLLKGSLVVAPNVNFPN